MKGGGYVAPHGQGGYPPPDSVVIRIEQRSFLVMGNRFWWPNKQLAMPNNIRYTWQHHLKIRSPLMRDLNQLYSKNEMKKTFINFFKSTHYKDAVAFLKDEGLPPEEILQRTRSHRGHAATCMAHEIVALAFIQWDDAKKFNKMLLRMIS